MSKLFVVSFNLTFPFPSGMNVPSRVRKGKDDWKKNPSFPNAYCPLRLPFANDMFCCWSMVPSSTFDESLTRKKARPEFTIQKTSEIGLAPLGFKVTATRPLLVCVKLPVKG